MGSTNVAQRTRSEFNYRLLTGPQRSNKEAPSARSSYSVH